MRKLKPTAPKLYLLRNVIRKPNPTKIMTWTSWKPAGQIKKMEMNGGDSVQNKDERNWSDVSTSATQVVCSDQPVFPCRMLHFQFDTAQLSAVIMFNAHT